MCGIAGHIALKQKKASAKNVQAMLDRLSPRGPDGEGIFEQSHVCLGHRRLKIIDLSEKAHQPMVDSELGLSLVFNGCIYNYKELRKELEAFGYRFFSNGDTEVLIKAYHRWGKDFLQKLNGMFALAILERDSGKVFLARDRLGIKPLYYTDTSDGFYFSSSLPSLLKIPNIDRSIDPEALLFYMSFHAVVPPPWTIVQSIRKLPQSSYLEIEKNGSMKMDSYWEASFNPSEERKNWSFRDWKQKTKEYLEKAVERRMIADVPVGVLLSGGVDSSLVVGLLDKLGHEHIETFSIGFDSTKEEEGNEFKYSDLIAKTFRTKHHKIPVGAEGLLSNLEDCVLSMSEPMVSHDNIGFYLLSKEVSKHVKVVQSGQGADEIFAGYHWYPPLLQSQSPVEDYKKQFFDRNFGELQETLSPDLVSEDFPTKFVEAHFAQTGANSAIDKALRIDSTVMLVDDPVKRVDNMTMRWSLEARVPFLDHELVEFAAEIPAQHKVAEGGKYILKEVARDIIPSEVIDRPKGYFPVPQLKYIQGESLNFVQNILNSSKRKQRGLYKEDYVQKLLQKPSEHITPLRGSKLWQLTLLEYWLQCHEI